MSFNLAEKLEEEYDLDNDMVLLADGFEDAFIGLGKQFTNLYAIYDRQKCIDILMQRDGMDHEEAEEYFEYNVQGAWMGNKTPLFLTRSELWEERKNKLLN